MDSIYNPITKIEAACLAKQAAEREAAKAQQNAAELQKQLQMSNPQMAEFKVHFKNVQEEMIKLKSTLDSIIAADADSGRNLTEAMKALIRSFARDFEV
jgi:soluble cytochrome b562